MRKNEYHYQNQIGAEQFLYFACVDADRKKVAEAVNLTAEKGVRLFFDCIGTEDAERPEDAAKAISLCNAVVLFLSKDGCGSMEFRNRINFALSIKKKIVCVRLDEQPLTNGLDM